MIRNRILYIHQYFKTPKEPGGTRSYWFSQELIKNGFQVLMITSRNNQRKWIERESVDGIEVIYIRNEYRNEFSIFKRLVSFIKFMLVSTMVAFKQKHIQLVYATSTPLTVGFPALLLKCFKGTDYIFEVRDLWPEVPIQMGAIRSKLLQRALYFFEEVIYKNAKHIVALSPGMEQGVIDKGIDNKKVSMIPNMSKVDKFYPREKNFVLMKTLGLKEDSFKVVHFGSMGIANGLDYIVDAAVLINEKAKLNVDFIFLGDGAVKPRLEEKVKKEQLENVFFLGKKPMEETSAIVNFCDVSVVPFMNLPILATNSPNKLFDSLSAGKPIIVNSNGWTKEMVENYYCGAYVNPENPKELAELLIDWSEDFNKLNKLGEDARILAESKYDKSYLVKQLVEVINNCI